MGPRKCQVCNQVQSKYKCPSCFTPYCSIPCFKKHKEIPCEKPVPSVEKPSTEPVPSVEKPSAAPVPSVEKHSAEPVPSVEKHSAEPVPSVEKHSTVEKPRPTLHAEKLIRVDDPSHLLQKTQLESIALSAEIRDALKDEDLQKLIYKIDSSKEAESELDRAMELDVFRIFSEKVLSAINL